MVVISKVKLNACNKVAFLPLSSHSYSVIDKVLEINLLYDICLFVLYFCNASV